MSFDERVRRGVRFNPSVDKAVRDFAKSFGMYPSAAISVLSMLGLGVVYGKHYSFNPDEIKSLPRELGLDSEFDDVEE